MIFSFASIRNHSVFDAMSSHGSLVFSVIFLRRVNV
jgi:hypothetical protein